MVGLELATETITNTLVKCEFYHRLYHSFTESYTSSNPDGQKMFSMFENQLPELYALVIILSVKVNAYIEPRRKIGQ
jgi:hypothetical protein